MENVGPNDKIITLPDGSTAVLRWEEPKLDPSVLPRQPLKGSVEQREQTPLQGRVSMPGGGHKLKGSTSTTPHPKPPLTPGVPGISFLSVPMPSISRRSPPDVLSNDIRILALLDAIAWSEGTDRNLNGPPSGYDVLVGGGHFHGYAHHPNIAVHLGRHLTSTAAGRYQFLNTTWAGLHRPNFTPHQQDIGAIMLLQRRRMIAPLLQGNIAAALRRGRNEWASLPGSPYHQHTNRLGQLLAVYNTRLRFWRIHS